MEGGIRRAQFVGYRITSPLSSPRPRSSTKRRATVPSKPSQRRGNPDRQSHSQPAPQMCPSPLGQLLHRLADRKRVKHVVREPRAHGDMPALPVFLGRAGGEGAVEVLRETDAHHAGKPQRDIHTAGEIAVDDQRVQQDQYGGIGAAQLVRLLHDGADGDKRRIRHGDFLEVAPRDPHEPLRCCPPTSGSAARSVRASDRYSGRWVPAQRQGRTRQTARIGLYCAVPVFCPGTRL